MVRDVPPVSSWEFNSETTNSHQNVGLGKHLDLGLPPIISTMPVNMMRYDFTKSCDNIVLTSAIYRHRLHRSAANSVR